MSGVEAIVGLVAAGAGFTSLAIQLGDYAQKLTKLYHNAKDAPKTISGIAFDIQTISLALHQLERVQCGPTSVQTPLMRCLVGCQLHKAQIGAIVAKMETRLSRLKGLRGVAYAAFKEPDIIDLLQGLERAKGSLQLAYMIYLTDEQRQQNETQHNTLARQAMHLESLQAQFSTAMSEISRKLTVLEQRPERLEVTSRSAVSHCQESDYATNVCKPAARSVGRPHYSKSLSKGYVRIRIQLPTWLCRRVWDVTISRENCRWSASLQTWNRVPRSSPILRCCLWGDLDGLRDLMANGQASATDYSYEPDGSPVYPLVLAARQSQVDVCQFLLDRMRYIDANDIMVSALSVAHESWGADSSRYAGHSDMYRSFLQHPFFDPQSAESTWNWVSKCATHDAFELILQHLIEIGDLNPSCASRFALASKMHDLPPDEFLKCVQLGHADPRLASLSTPEGFTVLHYIASNLALAYPMTKSTAWARMAKHVIGNGADVHATFGECMKSVLKIQTPLIKFLIGWSPDWVPFKLRLWLELLMESGLDLLVYGEKESAIWDSNELIPCCWGDIISLQNAAKIEDWAVTVSAPIHVPLFELRQHPGRYPSELYVPSTIFWPPDENDQGLDGAWAFAGAKTLFASEKKVQSLAKRHSAPIVALLNRAQDDTGFIAVLHDRSQRRRDLPRRSLSQPPRISREHARRCHSGIRWRAHIHSCPADGKWHVGCPRSSLRPLHLSPDLQIPFRIDWLEEVLEFKACVQGFKARDSLLPFVYQADGALSAKGSIP